MYLAARLLKIKAPEWKCLPWWEQQLYTDGLIWELEQGGIFPHAGGGGERRVPGQITREPISSMAERAALGITVIQ